MKLKSFVAFASLSVLGVAAALVVNSVGGGVLKVDSSVKYVEKDISLEFNASNLSNGSGTVTLNGNLFTYENLTVNGNSITLSANSRIYANEDSGSSVSAEGLKGAGFTNIMLVGGSGGTGAGELNGNAVAINVSNGGNQIININNNSFNFLVTSGSVVVERMFLSYGCAYDEAPEAQKVLFVGSDNFSVSSWKETYTEMLDAVEGVTATCDHFTTGSFTFLQVGNLTTNYANKAVEFREKLFSENWDAVVYQLTRRVTPSGTEFADKEFEMFRDTIVPLTRTVTNNIVLTTMQSSANPTIFNYDVETGMPVDSGENEEKTVEEMTTFMDETVVSWAEATGVKAGRYGKVFDYCGTVGSNTTTRDSAKAYSRGLMAYATINDTPVPDSIATIWASTCFSSTSTAAKKIKNDLGALVNTYTFN